MYKHKVHFLRDHNDKLEDMPFIALCDMWFFRKYHADMESHFTKNREEVTCKNCLARLRG